MCATQRTVLPAHWNFNSQPLCDKISFVFQEIDTSIYVPTSTKKNRARRSSPKHRIIRTNSRLTLLRSWTVTFVAFGISRNFIFIWMSLNSVVSKILRRIYLPVVPRIVNHNPAIVKAGKRAKAHRWDWKWLPFQLMNFHVKKTRRQWLFGKFLKVWLKRNMES